VLSCSLDIRYATLSAALVWYVYGHDPKSTAIPPPDGLPVWSERALPQTRLLFPGLAVPWPLMVACPDESRSVLTQAYTVPRTRELLLLISMPPISGRCSVRAARLPHCIALMLPVGSFNPSLPSLTFLLSARVQLVLRGDQHAVPAALRGRHLHRRHQLRVPFVHGHSPGGPLF